MVGPNACACADLPPLRTLPRPMGIDCDNSVPTPKEKYRPLFQCVEANGSKLPTGISRSITIHYRFFIIAIKAWRASSISEIVSLAMSSSASARNAFMARRRRSASGSSFICSLTSMYAARLRPIIRLCTFAGVGLRILDYLVRFSFPAAVARLFCSATLPSCKELP